MAREISDNLDFLVAGLHGRRSQMAEGARLEALCRAPTLPQFASSLWSGPATDSAAKIQRQLLEELAKEVSHIAAQLSSAGAELLRWLAVRFQLENLKVILRGLLTGVGPDSWQPHLLALPRELALDQAAAAATKSVEELVQLLPRGTLRKSLGDAVARYGEERHPFFYEAALDHGYFEELLVHTAALHGLDKELTRPLLLQEIDTWHLMLVARGKFSHRLDAKALLPMHVAGTGISRERITAMLADPDLRTAAERALGRALDALPTALGETGAASSPAAPAELEALARNRFLRLANRAFRRSHMGLAAVVAFVEMRRVEVANLITLSEGIRAQLPEEHLRARLIPRRTPEVAHV